MKRMKNVGLVLCGTVLGLALSAPAAQAVESLKAMLSANRIFVDGQEVQIEANANHDNKLIQLSVIGKADDADAMKQDIVDRTNALRRENGVAALRVNDKLMQAAQVRADEMAAHTVYSHTRPDGQKFNTVTDCPYMAENIHRIADWTLSEQTLAEQAVADWNTSAVHNKNMLNPKLSDIGIGLARGVNDNGNPCWYCVQLFLYDGYSVSRVDTLANK